jgi:hypothetical protein
MRCVGHRCRCCRRTTQCQLNAHDADHVVNLRNTNDDQLRNRVSGVTCLPLPTPAHLGRATEEAPPRCHPPQPVLAAQVLARLRPATTCASRHRHQPQTRHEAKPVAVAGVQPLQQHGDVIAAGGTAGPQHALQRLRHRVQGERRAVHAVRARRTAPVPASASTAAGTPTATGRSSSSWRSTRRSCSGS